ncbi:deoxyribodipyrimidine photolyase-related protein [Bradyrhizobium stylosanthis]|uniref:Deoxyribodipyrimidine photolyase-related protein n=2 Tax=Bradyrhizobium stylosanthis TaxID=1803665 RepID=A0A560D621_9BRAD|nr:deoxyribodipyrimidine photolyase-related protein [Bradyrhizobium stylosanthis]
MRNLVLVLGDQLDGRSAAFDGFDKERDVILQMEVMEEAAYITQHKLRIAYFFSSMRHFREDMTARGRRVHYVVIDDPKNTGSFETEIIRIRKLLNPDHVIALEPGDWRIAEKLRRLPQPVEIRTDRHFFSTRNEFAAFTRDHPRHILETFYRYMRRRTGVLMDKAGKPVGSAWNYDEQNRKPFGKHAPAIPAVLAFKMDPISTEVRDVVSRRFASSPGKLDTIDLPVSRAQALEQLEDFVCNRLPLFGTYQDAMRNGEPFLYHSRLSGPLNLHLLTPAEVIDAALKSPDAPLNALEGFVRQILGWREYVRGIYWQRMPHYADENALEAQLRMPRFFWTAETDMRCLADAISHTINHAYAHHIERLMVMGLFAMLLGVAPYEVHRWHMSMFWDAVDWVSLPNTLGMSQYGDGGVMGTKPYAASGAYINRMSDHCKGCRFDPKKSVGDDACPFTTLYWNFLAKHRKRFTSNGRMRNQYLNLDRKSAEELRAVRRRADLLAAKPP